MKRYIADIRSGIAAVVDTQHCEYDKDRRGLSAYDPYVVEYVLGHRVGDHWELPDGAEENIKDIAAKMNEAYRKTCEGKIATLRAENARLRRVVEAAKAMLEDDPLCNCYACTDLRNALAALDKDGE